MRQAAAPAAINASLTMSANSPAAAISKPPDVCGSNSNETRSTGTPAAIRTPVPKCSSFDAMPPDRFCEAIARAPAKIGTAPAAMVNVTPLPAAISLPCPASPKPVTSVHACTAPLGNRCTASDAARFNVRID